ncbi:MAG: helix-turn-helix domain-containing protein [Leptospira bouyouniensis]
MRYDPINDGIHKKYHAVSFKVIKAPKELQSIVHSYWEMKTDQMLEEDFILHVIPDACVNLLLNLLDTKIAAITMRKTEYVTLNLGKKFHYTGIQFLPGMWQGNPKEIVSGFVDQPYQGNLPLVATAIRLLHLEFENFSDIFSELVQTLLKEGIVKNNELISIILENLDEIESVEDMAVYGNLSSRQLQRKLKQATGFSPHDFLKIIRLQKALKGHYLDFYTDQSHFIHSFRKITGYTPKEYFKHFDV